MKHFTVFVHLPNPDGSIVAPGLMKRVNLTHMGVIYFIEQIYWDLGHTIDRGVELIATDSLTDSMQTIHSIWWHDKSDQK